MQRPVITDLARGVDRRLIGLSLVGLLALAIGYLGQNSWGVGSAASAATGAIVTDVIGSAGSRNPVRAKVSVAVTNRGSQQIRVLKPDLPGDGTAVLSLSPSELRVDPGAIGRVDADVSLRCDLPEPLRLPDLRMELRNGTLWGLPVSGSGMMVEACSRAASAFRPLVGALARRPAGTSPATGTSPTGGERLTVRLHSPTGRRFDVPQIRAGGVVLTMSPATVALTGKTPVVVHLTAPKSCPVQWQIPGIPSALSVDLRPPASSRPSRAAEFGATVWLQLGPAVASWLLATSCPAPQ